MGVFFLSSYFCGSTLSSPRTTARALMCENTPAGTFIEKVFTFFRVYES